MNINKNDLVKIAKRENNHKRSYLLVNPLQGKHVPVSPQIALGLFQDLASEVCHSFSQERLSVIGFAETATAIGASLASILPYDAFYIHTTREWHKDADYLYFSESHSHAAQQSLVKNRLDEIIEASDRLLFAEDEVTTGNTILHIIEVLRKEYPHKNLKFGVASILNGMNDQQLAAFEAQGIRCTFLRKLPPSDYSNLLSRYMFEPSDMHECSYHCTLNSAGFDVPGMPDPRFGIRNRYYMEACRQFSNKILSCIPSGSLSGKKVLVLGTEEFMFVPLLFAAQLEQEHACSQVLFHATTRSPILPCRDDSYPLFSRYEIRSPYDSQRITYLYNLTHYDTVFLLHDSQAGYHRGLESILSALELNQCSDIRIFNSRDSSL